MLAQSKAKGVLAGPVVQGLLLSASRHLVLLKGGETTSEGTVLFRSQVNRRVSLLFEFISCSGDSLLAENGEHLGDVLSNLLDQGQLHLGLGGHL